MYSIPICSKCGSTRITTHHPARRLCGAIGAFAGCVVGFITSFHNSTSGNPVGRLASGIVGALLGAASGAAAGVSIGDAIDNNILDIHRCTECGHRFGDQTSELIRDRPFPQRYADDDEDLVGPHGQFHPHASH